jgi:hypothetical protein
MWDGFRHLFGIFTDRVQKLELILLPKVSEELTRRRKFKISIPGTYPIDDPGLTLDYIEPTRQVLGTQQHRRYVFRSTAIGASCR